MIDLNLNTVVEETAGELCRVVELAMALAMLSDTHVHELGEIEW